MGIEGKNIFFTDETKIDTSPYTAGETIRLTPKKKKELKEGKEKAYNLINRQERKFEKSIMVAGGISFYGLSDLIILNGTMNEFAYSQALYYYKENYELFFKKNSNIYFEQDGARAHTSKKNKELIKQLFGDKFIQNAPNSPDLAYPIETLWAELKKRVK
ncbi:MAG: hypothetical protein IKO55_14185, partial [Kiritimatiellae bacterium]|nr:hypothetical protein [Kiritimatiellia bacterium]